MDIFTEQTGTWLAMQNVLPRRNSMTSSSYKALDMLQYQLYLRRLVLL